MIRDSVIYINIDNITSIKDRLNPDEEWVEPAVPYKRVIDTNTDTDYNKFLREDENPFTVNNFYTPEIDVPFNYYQDQLSYDIQESNKRISESLKRQTKEVVLTTNDVDDDNESVITDGISIDKLPENDHKYSYIYLRPVHTDNDSFIQWLSDKHTQDEILKRGYDDIFKARSRRYNISLQYLDYKPEYLLHLDQILKKPYKIFTFMCDPLCRAVRNFNSSNSFNTIYTFNEYYLYFGNKEGVGWTGKRCRTNNYFAHYLGFTRKEDITEDNVKQQFDGIFISEKCQQSKHLFKDVMEIESDIPIQENKNQSHKVNEFIRAKFIKNNELDYKLYAIACKILDDCYPEPEPEPEPESQNLSQNRNLSQNLNQNLSQNLNRNPTNY
jgi:hypothetical protein